MAVTIDAATLATEIGVSVERTTRILAVCIEKISEYLGDAYADAPESIVNESTIRLAGYLGQSDYGTIRDEKIGERSVSYAMNHANSFRTSGAMFLLVPYRVHRAGVI